MQIMHSKPLQKFNPKNVVYPCLSSDKKKLDELHILHSFAFLQTSGDCEKIVNVMLVKLINQR